MLQGELSQFGWDPFSEMRRLQAQVNSLFQDAAPTQAGRSAYPPVNLWMGDNSVAVTVELPGLAVGDVDLTVQEDILLLRGTQKPQSQENGSWHRKERPEGQFVRAIQLPFRVDADNVKARFEHGVLEVELERPHADRPRKIEIKGQ